MSVATEPARRAILTGRSIAPLGHRTTGPQSPGQRGLQPVSPPFLAEHPLAAGFRW